MATIIIPARWTSSRFPGKPLAELHGKPLIRHVWERCRRASQADRVIVATDDMRIAEVAFDFGAEVALTATSHPSGTDRVAEVAANLKRESLVVNVQGDEPTVDPRLIDRLITHLKDHPRVPMATAACPPADPQDLSNPHIVKVVVAADQRALYFSRAAIPADRDGKGPARPLHHLGIYAFRRSFLLRFVSWKPTPLEKTEKLEQLRALEHGAQIHVLLTRKSPPGIDTPDQLATANAASSRP